VLVTRRSTCAGEPIVCTPDAPIAFHDTEMGLFHRGHFVIEAHGAAAKNVERRILPQAD